MPFPRTLALTVALLITAPALAQPDPMDGGPATLPAAPPVVLVKPTVNAEKKQVEITAAFWNQKLADWIEMAVTGMESEFLHETIVAVPTTRGMLLDALRQAGFQDADAWTFSVDDFPRIRGDQALILLEVTRNGKTETYSLNELLCIRGWNQPPGALGWMFKGEPQGGEKILAEDPQVALQNRGLRFMANSVVDYPLSYDDWINPLPKYVRNYTLLPDEVYDSNGAVPVKLIIRKVTEEQLLTESAKVWHDRAAADAMLKLIPIAQQVDTDKAELLALVPKLRHLHDDMPTVPMGETDEGQRAALLAAKIDHGYAQLDSAMVGYAATHLDPRAMIPKGEPVDEQGIADTKEQAAAFAKHLANRVDLTAAVLAMEQANAQRRDIKKNGGSEADLKKFTGAALVARSTAQRLANAEIADYWQHEKARLDPKDPRDDYVRQINIEVELTAAKAAVANDGIALGKAIAADSTDRSALQEAYEKALEREKIASLQLELANVEFEISKREGFESTPELADYKQQRDQLKAKLAALQGAPVTETKP